MDPNRQQQQQQPQQQQPSSSSSSSSRQQQQQQPRSDSQLHATASFNAGARPPATPLRPTPTRQHRRPSWAVDDSGADEHAETSSVALSRLSRYSITSLSRPSSAATPDTDAPPDRQPSIRVRRSSAFSSPRPSPSSQDDAQRHAARRDQPSSSSSRDGRPRSSSLPSSVPPAVLSGDTASGRARNAARRAQHQVSLPRLTEEGARPTMAELGLANDGSLLPTSPDAATETTRERSHSAAGESGLGEDGDGSRPTSRRRSFVGRMLRPTLRRRSALALPQTQDAADARHEDEFNEELVDWLDIIDPEVQTLSTLTNVQNSLFVPDLGGLINRRPTYVLSQPEHFARDHPPPPAPEEPTIREEDDGRIVEEAEEEEGAETEAETETEAPPPEGDHLALTSRIRRSTTITSRISESHFAALPHGETLEGWTAAEKWELDDHVRHMMHSRRSRFKRQMKGFGQYVRRPLGFFVTLYATLITLFGLAWVLFLIGWIHVGTQQVYAIHIIDSVLVALFAIMGDGLAPFRAVDSYHTFFIVRYSNIIAKARRKAALATAGAEKLDARNPPNAAAATEKQRDTTNASPSEALVTAGDAPRIPAIVVGNSSTLTPAAAADEGVDPLCVDVEDAKSSSASSISLELDPLTPKQRRSLEHHQKKLAKSHSFYKPQETFTHHAFPLGYLMAIIILLDFHSCLQISLGACTWGIDYHHRPFALTTVILCVSICCNLTAGLVIMFGDRRTRKKDVVELLNRQALTGAAIKKVKKKRNKGQGQGKDKDTDSDGVLTGQNSANM